MFFTGLDIGSTITKIVIKNETEICSTVIRPTGAEHRRLAHKIMEEALKGANLSFDKIDYIVATGYGRINVPFADIQVTEITCHMRGVNWLFPGVKTIIDIGGQDSKGIKVENGKLVNFVMNDKCAAGTGRFLEVISEVLGVKLEDIGEISLRSTNPADISSICTVFAEQEALLRLSEGTSIEDILAGILKANASRIYSMVRKIKIEKEVAITGGGAKNIGFWKALEEKIGFPVVVPPEPLITGALGAALIAAEKAGKMSAEELKENRKKRKLEAVTFFDGESTRGQMA
ncbi:MAG: 2-hydroxyglutaryl-CoA dehydratase [Deltaproteobacteria bacterium]|nr:2-hydroxyglutaryl-CoA dehydratase [Deltaproteobacteria bacterium]MBW2200820.1 2-hydroxyglutaryl-CoA dehydratase [Deltaproteobacteria bacterium]